MPAPGSDHNILVSNLEEISKEEANAKYGHKKTKRSKHLTIDTK